MHIESCRNFVKVIWSWFIITANNKTEKHCNTLKFWQNFLSFDGFIREKKELTNNLVEK